MPTTPIEEQERWPILLATFRGRLPLARGEPPMADAAAAADIERDVCMLVSSDKNSSGKGEKEETLFLLFFLGTARVFHQRRRQPIRQRAAVAAGVNETHTVAYQGKARQRERDFLLFILGIHTVVILRHRVIMDKEKRQMSSFRWVSFLHLVLHR